MVDISKSVVPALVVPLLLIISVAVYMSTTDSTSFAFETAVVAEATGDSASGAEVVTYTVSHCKDDSVTEVSNTTIALTVSDDYNVTYTPLGVATITVGEGVPGGAILVTYTAYKGDGYTSFDKMNTQTYAGFKLATILPYVILSMVILAIVIGGLTFR